MEGRYGVAYVASFFAHTCAVLQRGDIHCWGLNTHGQCDVPRDLKGKGKGKNVNVNINVNMQQDKARGDQIRIRIRKEQENEFYNNSYNNNVDPKEFSSFTN